MGNRPRRVFVNSMSDLFHPGVTDTFIQSVFDTMVRAHWHNFQVLTKRAERLPKISSILPWPTNVWIGVSVEGAEYTWRMDHLRKIPAAVRFVSIEPLLGPIPDLDLEAIDWVIVGGEAGQSIVSRILNGFGKFAISALKRRFRSFLSNGAGPLRSLVAVSWMAERGTKCQTNLIHYFA